ncbi:MAG: NfeD family protein [Candidatus Omnitrophica bacterium]|nr:NfeD family protein [Candidatus Omnitrophota bacterium]
MDALFIIYVICFGVGLLFALISAFAADVFGGHDAHFDVGHSVHVEPGIGAHEMPGFSPLSPTTIAAFVTAFGGLGMIFSEFESTHTPLISAVLAAFGGLVIAALVFLLFQQIFRRTQSSSESKVAELIGQSATIITAIPEKGVGEIAYIQSGCRYTAPAREESGTAIPNGQTVVITRIVGSQFYVVPV